MAVLCPNLEQDVALDLLFYTGFDLEHEDLFLCLIFTQRLMNEQKIEPSDKRCLGHWVSNKFWLILYYQNLFDSQISVFQEWWHFFLKRACRCQQRLQPTRKRPAFVLARLTRPSCA